MNDEIYRTTNEKQKTKIITHREQRNAYTIVVVVAVISFFKVLSAIQTHTQTYKERNIYSTVREK